MIYEEDMYTVNGIVINITVYNLNEMSVTNMNNITIFA